MQPDNPFASPWNNPFDLPPFERIRPEHFRPAYDAVIAEHEAEIEAIAGRSDAATFVNTVEACEQSGRALRRVSGAFHSLTGAHTNDAIKAIEREMAPIMARHRMKFLQNGAILARIDALWGDVDSLGLDAEQRRVLELYHRMFVRAGARLDEAGKRRLSEIVQRLATLGTAFSQNVLADESEWMLVLDDGRDLDGLPQSFLDAAARAAAERGLPGKRIVTLGRSMVEPFLTYSARADLREKVFDAWVRRGENAGATDNRAIIAEIVALRVERAKLLGFPTFAHFILDNAMAKTPEAVRALLDEVWTPARARAIEERGRLQSLAAASGENAPIRAADWRYWAEKVRLEDYEFDAAQLTPYLALDRIVEAAFDTATRLFGLTFKERFDLPRYHPDVRSFEVLDAASTPVGIFMGDYFARPSKRSGAWARAIRSQERLSGDVRPVIVNVLNLAKGGEGKPALISFEDARTVFHEFGHALHGLLSDVTYPMIAGTSVERDFVELPSQLYEHWLESEPVLARFARHAETNEPMPAELLKRMKAARNFNQGFATVEFLASAIVDQELHLLENGQDVDVVAREKEVLDRIGLPDGTAMRHRTPHFSHVFSGDGYSAGYYSYLWSEVMDADAFAAFEETGDVFDPEIAKRLKEFIYSAGGRRRGDEAYTAFRGRMPTSEALLKQRGLA
jgi:peptidyl-dipeptidase Dcp